MSTSNTLPVQRRIQDAVEDLPQGFTLREHGRTGYVYYRRDTKVLKVYVELSGAPEYDFLVDRGGFREWVVPAVEPISAGQVAEIEDEFVAWETARGWRTDLQANRAMARLLHM